MSTPQKRQLTAEDFRTIPCLTCGREYACGAVACPSCGAPNPNPIARLIALRGQKSKGTHTALAVCLGFLGVHNFYIGKHGKGAFQLVLGLTVFGGLISWPWALAEILTTWKDAQGVPFSCITYDPAEVYAKTAKRPKVDGATICWALIGLFVLVMAALSVHAYLTCGEEPKKPEMSKASE